LLFALFLLIYQVLRHCTAQDEFSLACVSSACRQASIDRRVITIKRLSGISGKNQRRIIEDYNTARLKSGKRAVKEVKGKLHPAIRRLILETTPDEMARRVFSHLVDVVKGYHEKGRILMSAHSHFVTLCHAANRLKLGNALKLTTKAFVERLACILRMIDGRPDGYRYYTIEPLSHAVWRDLVSTLVLGRFLTHPGGFEKGWADLFKLKRIGVRGKNLYPHGHYYCCFMETKSSLCVDAMEYTSTDDVSAAVLFRNFHFKPGSTFRSVMIPSKTTYISSRYRNFVDTIKHAPGLSADELTVALFELHTDCDNLPVGRNTFRTMFCYIMDGHPDVFFSEPQLEKIGHAEILNHWHDCRKYEPLRYVRMIARLVGVLRDSFPGKASACLQEVDFANSARAICIPEFIELANFAADHCTDVFEAMGAVAVAYMDYPCFKDIGKSRITELAACFPGVAFRLDSSLARRYRELRNLPQNFDDLQGVCTDVFNDMPADMFERSLESISLSSLLKKRTGRSWKRLGLTRIFAYPPNPHSIVTLVQWIVNRVVIPVMGELKRAREEKEDHDNREETNLYAKKARLQ